MIIEKTMAEGSRYDVELNNYADDKELVVTITLNEYRTLVRESVENKMRKDHENWFEQYNRANEAERKVKELELQCDNLMKRLVAKSETDCKCEDDEETS